MDKWRSESVIHSLELRKQYVGQDRPAVAGLSLEVKRGELFGLIGPDGAGKTTFMRMLATLLLPDSGDAQVLGHDIKLEYRQIRRRIGYMPGKFSLYMDLTVGENLHFFATLFGTTVATHYDLIAPIYEQLAPFKERRAGQLSGGMKQKLALCCALIHKPDLLLLDEPTTGVDTVSRKEFWDMLALLSSQGMTLLVSTPYMDEAARCQRIALMQTGEILAVDSPEAIIRAYPEPLFAATASNMALLLRTLRAHHAIQSCFAFGENVHFTFSDYGDDVLRLLKADMLAAGLTDFTVDRIQPSIEDCFIQLMHP